MPVDIIRKVSVSGGTVLRAANNLGDLGSTATARTNLGVYSTAESAALANPRAPRQALAFDGSGNAVGLSIPASYIFTLAAVVNPTSFGGSGRVLLRGTGPTFEFGITAAGLIYVWDGTTYLLSSTALVANIDSAIAYTRTGTVGTFYINGVSAGTVTDSRTYGNIIDLGGTNPTAGFLGRVGPLYYFNRALTAAEVLALYQEGAPRAADFNDASNTAINSAPAVDGVAGANTFAATAGGSFSGASANGFSAVSGGGAYAAGSFQPNFSVQPGQIISVTYTATVNSGTVLASLMNSAVSSISAAHTVTTGTRTVEFIATAASANARVIFGSSAGLACNFVVSAVAIVRVGLLCAPDANESGIGYQWHDMSGSKADHTLPVSGVSWVLPGARNYVRKTLTWAGTHEAKSLLGQRCIPNNAVLESCVVKSSAATTGSGMRLIDSTDAVSHIVATPLTTTRKVLNGNNFNGQNPAGTSDALCNLALDPDTLNFTGSIDVQVNFSAGPTP